MNILLLAAALVAQAGTQWVPVAQDAQGQYFLDPSSIGRDAQGVRFRVRAVAASAGPGGVRSLVSTIVADCAGRTFRPVEVSLYNDGGTLLNSARGDGTTIPVVAGSSDEVILRQVCQAR